MFLLLLPATAGAADPTPGPDTCWSAVAAAITRAEDGDPAGAWRDAEATGARCGGRLANTRAWLDHTDPPTPSWGAAEWEAAALASTGMLGPTDPSAAADRVMLAELLLTSAPDRALGHATAAAAALVGSTDPEARATRRAAVMVRVALLLPTNPPGPLADEVESALRDLPPGGEVDSVRLALHAQAVVLAMAIRAGGGGSDRLRRAVDVLAPLLPRPDFPALELLRAQAEALLAPNPAEAETWVRRWVALTPSGSWERAEALGNLGTLLLTPRSGGVAKAAAEEGLATLREAVLVGSRVRGAADPDLGMLRVRLAEALLHAGQPAAAAAALPWLPDPWPDTPAGADLALETARVRAGIDEADGGLGAAVRGLRAAATSLAAARGPDDLGLFVLGATELHLRAIHAPDPDLAPLARSVLTHAVARVEALPPPALRGRLLLAQGGGELLMALGTLGDAEGVAWARSLLGPWMGAAPAVPRGVGPAGMDPAGFLAALEAQVATLRDEPTAPAPVVLRTWSLLAAVRGQDDPARGIATLREALAWSEGRLGPRQVDRIGLASHLATAVWGAGGTDEALALGRASLDALEAATVDVETGTDEGLVQAQNALSLQIASDWVQATLQTPAGGGDALAYLAVLRAKGRMRTWLRQTLGGGGMEAAPGVGEVAASLPRGAVLIEWFLWMPTTGSRGPRYAGFVVGPEGVRGLVDLGPVAPIDAAVADLRAAVRDPVAAAAAAAALRRRVVAPLLPLVGDTSRWVVAPDGLLTLAPLGLVLDPLPPGGWSLVESGRELVDLGHPTPAGAERAPAVVVGEVDYDAGTGAARARRWGALPGAPAEVAAVASVWPGATVLRGAEASEAALTRLHGPHILHVATHGEFGTVAEAAPPGLALRGLQVVGSPAPAPVSTDPWRDSRLVLAGANREGEGGADGYLDAREAAALDLHGTELVVLSACETAVGSVRAGDGVVGLRRALGVAGARSLILSLWPVDDAATTVWMGALHRALAAGRSRAEAVADAQAVVRARPEWAAPHYWAGFVLIGDSGPL